MVAVAATGNVDKPVVLRLMLPTLGVMNIETRNYVNEGYVNPIRVKRLRADETIDELIERYWVEQTISTLDAMPEHQLSDCLRLHAQNHGVYH